MFEPSITLVMPRNEKNQSNEEKIRNLLLVQKEAEKKIRNLEAELYSEKENSKAWENLYELLIEEKKEARQIITMHENLGGLVRIEKKESRNAIEALIEHQRISQTEIQQKALTLKNILHINKEIIGVPSGNILLEKILVSIIHVLNFERGAVLLFRKSELKREISFNIYDIEIQSNAFQVNWKIINESINSEKTRIQVFSDFAFEPEIEEMCIVSSPLIIQNRVVGVVYFDSRQMNHVLRELDIDTIEVFSSQLALAIESNGLYEKLELEFQSKAKELNETNLHLNSMLKNIKSDMKLAKKIQEKLLPSNIEFPDIEFSVFYQPMFEIGGDIYDIIKIRDGYYRVFLADATGHGIQAALATTLIKGEYDKLRNENERPAELLRNLNKNFMAKYKSLNLFFSCIVVDINRNTRKVTFSSAGHPPQIFLANGQVFQMEKKGRLIGIKEDVMYEVETIEYLNRGKLFLFTDGLFEEFNDEQEMFGEERLLELVSKNADKSTAFQIRKSLSELKKFTGFKDRFDDDITIIGIEI